MSGTITHVGKVIEVNPGEVDVIIEAQGACSACKVKSACGMAESQDKLLSVVTEQAFLYQVGEKVEVAVDQRLGIRAATIAYILPFLLVLGVLLSLLQVGVEELYAGLCALGMLGVYYFGLYFLRDKLSREITFEIRKLKE